MLFFIVVNTSMDFTKLLHPYRDIYIDCVVCCVKCNGINVFFIIKIVCYNVITPNYLAVFEQDDNIENAFN